MKPYESIIVFFVACLLNIFIFSQITSNLSTLPPISYDTKIADLNELDTRNMFCQAMGYKSSTLVEGTEISGWRELEYTNMGYGKYSGRRYQVVFNNPDVEIVCRKPADDIKEQFSYEKYKRWMLNIQINNRS